MRPSQQSEHSFSLVTGYTYWYNGNFRFRPLCHTFGWIFTSHCKLSCRRYLSRAKQGNYNKFEKLLNLMKVGCNRITFQGRSISSRSLGSILIYYYTPTFIWRCVMKRRPVSVCHVPRTNSTTETPIGSPKLARWKPRSNRPWTYLEIKRSRSPGRLMLSQIVQHHKHVEGIPVTQRWKWNHISLNK